jgi:hypothetical protein
MIFGTPVSGFEKKSEEIIWKKVLAVQQYAEFGLEESCGGGENGLSGKERDDICLVGSRSPMTGVALEWHQPGCLIWKRDARRARARPQNSISPVALHRWNLQSDRPANRVQKTEMSVQDWAWSEFLTHQGADL